MSILTMRSLARFVLAVGIGAVPLLAQPAWYNNSWSSRKQITVNHTMVSGGSNLTNFPILVTTTDANLKGVTYGGSVGTASGIDIFFTGSNGVKLDHEIETYDQTTGKLVAWVRIASLSPSADTVIYIYYGNAAATDQQNKTGVWAPDGNYRGVWHLPNGSTLNTADSITGVTAAVTGATAGSGVPGLGGGVSLNGSGSSLNYGNLVSPVDQVNKTVSVWVNPSNLAACTTFGRFCGIVDKDFDNGAPNYGGWGLWVLNTGQINWWVASNLDLITPSSLLTQGAWTYVTVTWNPSTLTANFYVNGVLSSTGVNNSIVERPSLGQSLVFGSVRGSSLGNLPGQLDEVRISSGIRSADSILTEYRNQSAPASYFTWGSQTGSGGANYNSWTSRKQITVSHTMVSGGSALANFPVLVTTTDANLKSAAYGGSVGKADGTDILFTDSNGVKLDHEIETYDQTTGKLVAWVRVPSLSPAADTILTAYYGNASASDQQSKTSVWLADGNYKGIWHLANGSALNTVDTISGVSATVTGASAGAGVTGMGGGASLNGSGSSLNYGDLVSSLDQVSKTVSVWVKPTNLAACTTFGRFCGVVDKDFDNGAPNYGGWGLWVLNTGQINWWVASNLDLITPTSLLPQGAWTYVAVTWNPSTLTASFYVNGTLSSTGVNNSIVERPSLGQSLVFGSVRGSSLGNLPGQLDEIRISRGLRSADWILTEYRNQSAPASYFTWGSQTGNGGGGGTVNITVTSNPASLGLTVDSASCTAPCTFAWTPGSTHTIAAAAVQPGATGVQYVFANWSDSLPQSHSITTPASATTYTVSYSTQYLLTTSANPPAGGTVSPGSGWYNVGTVVSVSATAANSSWTFAGFAGALTGTTTPQSLTMNSPATVTANFHDPVTISFATVPNNLQLRIDGVLCTAGFSCIFLWDPSSRHTIVGVSPQQLGNTPNFSTWVFSSWSDGLGQTHDIIVPSTGIIYTANFNQQTGNCYTLTYGVNGNPNDHGVYSAHAPPTVNRIDGNHITMHEDFSVYGPNAGLVFHAFADVLLSKRQPD